MTRASAISLVFLVGAALAGQSWAARPARADFDIGAILTDGYTGRTRLDRCLQRCQYKYGPTPTPSVLPTPEGTSGLSDTEAGAHGNDGQGR